MSELAPKALIADDEPLLIQALENELKLVWPELVVISRVGDGASAISELMTGEFDIAFLDVKMPAQNGVEVMQAVIEDWPDATAALPPPLFVFVTAFQQFAIDAFELAAIDYIVKPVTAERLQKTIERLKSGWAARTNNNTLDRLVGQASGLVVQPQPVQTRWMESVRAGIGDTVHLIPVQEIIMFEASDKYVVVHTAGQQALIREPLRALLPRLNPALFKQIHRSVIVNMNFVESASRIDASKMRLNLKGSEQTPSVSRLYRHLFKAM